MPVTAKLSKLFYDRLGEQVANELVEWFNQVDATYRSELRDINELNFARFSAESGQRFAEMNAKLEKRLAEMDAKWEKRFAELEKKVEVGFAQQDARITHLFKEQTEKFERLFREQMRFLYVALVAQMALIAGLTLK